MRAYIDSDVLIWYLRGKSQARRFLHKLRDNQEYELWIGAIQRAEVVFFMRPEEKEATISFLSNFHTAPVDQAIVDTAGAIYRKWNPAHGVDFNDAILAGTVSQTGGRIFCLNKKHYPMPEISIVKAW